MERAIPRFESADLGCMAMERRPFMARRIHRSVERALFVVGLGLSCAVGCSSVEHEEEATTEKPREPLSDAQIVGVVSQIDRAETEQAELALGKIQDSDVRSLAETIITDHKNAEGKLQKIMGGLRLTSVGSETASEERRHAEGITALLERSPKADFDATYLETQIYAHRRALNLIDQALLPDTKDAELRQLLTDIRATIAQHHLQALRLRKKFPPLDSGT
jgi:putative membrane protein